MIPPQGVQDAFLAPISEITRRIEIYEQDGETPWRPEIWPELLVGGAINADNGSDERRTIDLTLANYNSAIDPTIGKLWYDKVIKPFYGVKLSRDVSRTRLVVIEAPDADEASAFIAMLPSDVAAFYRPTATSLADVAPFDVVVAIGGTEELTKADLIAQAFDNQKSVMTISTAAPAHQFPVLSRFTTPLGSRSGSGVGIDPTTSAELSAAVGAGWRFSRGFPVVRITGVNDGVGVVATTLSDPSILSRAYFAGARWIHMQQPGFTSDWFTTTEGRDQCAAFVTAAARWLDVTAYTTSWEMQLGEYVQDAASVASEDPNLVEITGRDYVKRCQVSRLVASTTYDKGRTIESVIGNMALNSKVRKISLPDTGAVLDRDMTWEADVERWEVMKELATSHNYDLHFDTNGVLVMEKFRDPSSAPVDLLLNVGPLGNLVSRGLRTSDSQLYNHVVVVGEGADSDAPPVWSEAINNAPNSPSRVDELGDRVIRHQAATITTVAQARELAQSMLSVAALEEFELNFSIPLLPWVEPNQVIGMTEEAAGTWGPDRFLLSSLSMPLDLSPMSGTGKRIINVT